MRLTAGPPPHAPAAALSDKIPRSSAGGGLHRWQRGAPRSGNGARDPPLQNAAPNAAADDPSVATSVAASVPPPDADSDHGANLAALATAVAAPHRPAHYEAFAFAILAPNAPPDGPPEPATDTAAVAPAVASPHAGADARAYARADQEGTASRFLVFDDGPEVKRVGEDYALL